MKNPEARRGDGAAFPWRLILLLPAPVAALIAFGDRFGAWWLPPATALALSMLTFGCFVADKRAARLGAPRVPESALHLLELLGGWPGAVLAQDVVRHKSAKLSHRIVLWLIIAAHNCVAIDSLLGWTLVGRLADLAR